MHVLTNVFKMYHVYVLQIYTRSTVIYLAIVLPSDPPTVDDVPLLHSMDPCAHAAC